MKISRFMKIPYLLTAVIYCVGVSPNAKSQDDRQHPMTIGAKQIKALALAIQDEVYDYTQQRAFRALGSGKTVSVTFYVNPKLNVDGAGEVIYQDMPYGEVIRQFHVRPDGLVAFYSDPQIGFPQTQPSHLTQFLDVAELRKDKEQWLRSKVQIDKSPSKKQVIAAANRQLIRRNFSDFFSKKRIKAQ